MTEESFISDRIEDKSNDIARRQILRSISAGGLAGTAGLVGASNGVSAESNKPVTKERSAEESEIEETLSDPIVEYLLNTLSISPGKISRSEATVRSLENEGKKLSSIISIPTKYGVLRSSLNENDEITYIDLQRSKIPKGIEKKISGSVGWPKNTNAKVVAKSTDDPIIFARSPTNKEREDALRTSETKENEKSSVSIISELKKTTSNSRKKRIDNREVITVFTKKTIIHIDYDDMGVNETIPTSNHFTQSNKGAFSTQSTDCDSMAISCAADLILSAPNCGLAMAGCGVFGPMSVACALTIISICLPGAAVTIYSCEQYGSQCDNPTL